MSEAASLLPLPRFVVYDAATGDPVVGGFVHTYIPDSTTPAETWQDAGQTTPNSNPIILDSSGSCLIYGLGQYQLTVTDALGNAVPGYSGLSTSPGSGSGSVTGPDSSTSGSLAAFSGTSGTVLEDTDVFPVSAGVFTNLAMNIAAPFLVNGLSPTVSYTTTHPTDPPDYPNQPYATQALVGGLVIPSYATVVEGDGVYGYCDNYAAWPPVNGVAVAGICRGLAAGTLNFGANFLVTDSGFACHGIVGCEWDINCSNLDTAFVLGNNFVFGFPTGTPAGSVGVQVSATGYPIATAFASATASAQIAFAASQLTAADGSNSQPIYFYTTDPSGTVYSAGLTALVFSGGCSLVANVEDGAFIVGGALLVGTSATITNGIFVTPYTDGTTLTRYEAVTSSHTTTSSGTTAAGSMTVVVASATGIADAQSVLTTDPAVAPGTVVTHVSGTTITLSSPLLLELASGTSLEFYSTMTVGSVTTNGTTTAYNTTSDHRLKTVHGPADGSVISQLRVYDVDYIADPEHIVHAAFLAHEVQQIVPHAVTGKKDAVDVNGGIIPQMLDRAALVPYLVAHAQELEDRITKLEAIVAAQQIQIDRLIRIASGGAA
jgi:hypothetical protein